ncbi:MAG: hypothetical protein SNH01_02925 [Rikenellaceae bacterium]
MFYNEDEQSSVDPKPKPKREYTIKQREFSSYDLDFWGVYGITIAILQRFNVVALDEFVSLVEGCAPKRYYYSLGTPMYGYLQRTYIKIYRPNSTVRFLFGGEKERVNSSEISTAEVAFIFRIKIIR